MLPYLDAGTPYAQFPAGLAGLTWDAFARLPYQVAGTTAPHQLRNRSNNNLKAMARVAGIAKHLTAHSVSHSLADRDRRLSIAAADMRDMLNHHSIAQTEE